MTFSAAFSGDIDGYFERLKAGNRYRFDVALSGLFTKLNPVVSPYASAVYRSKLAHFEHKK